MENNSFTIRIGNITFRNERLPDGTYISTAIENLNPSIPANIRKERRLLAKFSSSSSPGVFHYVYEEVNGDVTCSCYGFRAPEHCWHYKKVIAIGPSNITEPLTK